MKEWSKIKKLENHPVNIFKNAKLKGKPVLIGAPMVRYSKLPFRMLLRKYGSDIVYSPMILAREFVRSEFARNADFSTNENDSPLIIQFGVNNVTDAVRASKMVQPFCDGVGINCGCPIEIQNKQGIGAALLDYPELVSDIVRSIKQECGDDFCVEVKIRLIGKSSKSSKSTSVYTSGFADNSIENDAFNFNAIGNAINNINDGININSIDNAININNINDDINDCIDVEKTINYALSMEKAGADYIVIHGRTRTERSSMPIHIQVVKKIKQRLKIPVVINGNVFTMQDINCIYNYTKCDGIMVARGLLLNPGLFKGFLKTPWGAIEIFLDYYTCYGLLPFRIAQFLIAEMLSGHLTKKQKKLLNDNNSFVELIDWLDLHFDVKRYDEEGFGERHDVPWKEIQQ